MAKLYEDDNAVEMIKEIIKKRISNKICCLKSSDSAFKITYTVFPFCFYDTKYDTNINTGRYFKSADEFGNWKLFDKASNAIDWLDENIHKMAYDDFENSNDEERVKCDFKGNLYALGKFEIEISVSENEKEVNLDFIKNGTIIDKIGKKFTEELSLKSIVDIIDDFIKIVLKFLNEEKGELVLTKTYSYEWGLKSNHDRIIIDTDFVNERLL